MIQPSSGTVVVPQQTLDGIWILNVIINAPSVTGKVNAQITVAPFSSQTGTIAMDKKKTIFVDDVFKVAASSSYVADAMEGIYGYVQEQVVSKSLF